MTVAVAPLNAQLEPIGVPKGLIRFDLYGDWTSYDSRYLNGGTSDYLADFSRPALGGSFWPDIQTTDTAIAGIIGSPAYGLNLGKETTHGVATVTTAGINLAAGLTRRISVFADFPLVTTRVQAKFTLDSSSGNAGFNPAHPIFGGPGGQAGAQQFFTDFDLALGTLNSRINSGFYGAGSALEAHAIAVAQQATTLRDRLGRISNDPVLASPFLPVDTSTAGVAILGEITALQDTLANAAGLDIPNFTSTIPLPSGRLSTDDYKAFESNPLGLIRGFPLQEAQRTSLGDIRVGADFTLIDAWDRSGHLGGIRAVATGSVTFPTGKVDDPSNFLDIGNGSNRYVVGAALTADLGYRRLGARLTGSYDRRFSRNLLARVTPPSQPMAYIDRLTRVTLDAGDLVAFSAQPYLRLAPQLALSAGVRYWNEGAATASYFSSSDVLGGISAGVLAEQSARSATTVTAGLSYVGRAAQECKNGKCGFPVDAMLSYERVVSATGGRVPNATTVRAGMRLYRRLW
jgi:hypothetical protein